MTRIKLFLATILAIFSWQAYGQSITGLETKWNDSFREWVIYTEGDSIEGSLDIIWKLNDDWTEWQFELGAFSGQAKLGFNDPNYWEFRSGNDLVTARTVWSQDFSEWRCTDGTHIIRLRSKYQDLPAIWYSEGEEYGYIDIYREYEQDPRVWLVEDHLDPDISELFRIALVFLAVFHSTPRM